MQTLCSLHKFFPQCEFCHLLVPQLESGSEKELINPFQIFLFFPFVMPQWNVFKTTNIVFKLGTFFVH
jgi:hypothetical protein